MGIFNEFNKKEKPVFTGLKFGFGSGGGGGAPAGPFSASGGNKNDGATPGNGYAYHTFSTSGSFVVSGGESKNVECLIVGGGGAADFCSGGGGGGGIAYIPSIPLSAGTYAVTVGTGADNANNQPRAPQPNGGDSSIVLPVGTVTGKGGGTPGDYNPGNSYPMPSIGGGGGSGGGGGTNAPQYPPDAPYPSAWNQGHPATQPSQPTYGGVVVNYGEPGGNGGPGGPSPNNNFLTGGGGGGAGSAGESAGPSSAPGYAGKGGDGQPFPQFAYPLVFPGPDASDLGPYSPNNSHYGGGGGGGLHKAGGGSTGVPSASGGKGGHGGGGNGENGPENFAGNPNALTLGKDMLGGGSGAVGGNQSAANMSGGDGIVIIRYQV